MKLAKIPPADIRFLLATLPRLEAEEKEMRHIIGAQGKSIFASNCRSPSWCQLYEYPFPEHVARIAVAFDAGDILQECAGAARPILAAKSYLLKLEDDDSVLTAEEKENIRPNLGLIFGLVTSLLRSLQCLMAYGVYLNDLVALVRLGNRYGDQALFKAVRIDPTAIGSPSIHSRISRAVLEDDQKFISSLKKAINGPLSKQHQANADKIRFVLQVLHEFKVERLSDDELHDLFVQQLALYSATSKANVGDAAKGIRAIADRMKKAKAST